MNRTTKTGILLAVVSTIAVGIVSASADYVARFAASDAPPLEGRKEAVADRTALTQQLRDISSDLKAYMLERRLDAAWALVCAAKNAKALPTVGGAQIEFATLQQEHMKLLGSTYPLGDCP